MSTKGRLAHGRVGWANHSARDGSGKRNLRTGVCGEASGKYCDGHWGSSSKTNSIMGRWVMQ